MQRWNVMQLSYCCCYSDYSLSLSHSDCFKDILASAVARLFTTKIATYYEEFYQSKGVKFVKGTVLASFDFNSDGKVSYSLVSFKISVTS